MRAVNILTLFFIFLTGCFIPCKAYDSDSIHTSICPDSAKTANKNKSNWIRQLINNGFHINDPAINYPKFPKFCVNVYNWGDRTFNQYDSTYVVGTGKNWKTYFRNDNWIEGYMLKFPEHENIIISSSPYSELGVSLCFMAVSLSYTVNANKFYSHTKDNRQRFNFNFTSGLFSANIHYSSIEGGAKILRFANYEMPHFIPFNDIITRSFYADAYYFFNHRHYSQTAAYNYSRFQLKSAGTWLAGLLYTRQTISIDFSNLSPEMIAALPTDQLHYFFHYRSYTMAGGYAYNWVLQPRKWLVNITVLPSVGLRQSFEDGSYNRRTRFATNLRGMLGVVYNHRRLFASVTSNFYGHGFFDDSYAFFNTSVTASATVGIRF